MKFSYSLLKKLLPGVKRKRDVIEALTMYSFEAEEAPGNTIEVSLPPNRYSDAASHIGIAKELGAIWGKKPSDLPLAKLVAQKEPRRFSVSVEEPALCPRYTACLLERVKVEPSPAWMQTALKECGLRPISNVVDVMNYVMLETGQPLHAFDFEKILGKRIVVRRAKKGEGITTIDGQTFALSEGALVIADEGKPVAIAGIKGGSGPEVSSATTSILIEAANFDSVGIYTTSRAINLATDASARFSHEFDPALTWFALRRAAKLLAELAGAKIVESFDSSARPAPIRLVKVDAARVNKLLGTELTEKEIVSALSRLGFKKKPKSLWEAPPFRTDIETHEDMIEEVIRIMGYGWLPARPPRVSLRPGAQDNIVVGKEKARKLLAGFGFSEIYGSSFVSKESIGPKGEAPSLLNPVSAEFEYLRPELGVNIGKSFELNAKFSDEVKVFEIGKVFRKEDDGVVESTHCALGMFLKQGDTFHELKGAVGAFLKAMGLDDLDEKAESTKPDLLIYSVQGEKIGYISPATSPKKEGSAAICEFDLDKVLALVAGELGYRPIPKYPSIMRDISILVTVDRLIGDIMESIELSGGELVRDVDLIDEYIDAAWNRKQSITFRIVFQSEERTLTSEEVDTIMKKIERTLRERFDAEIR